MGSRRCKKIECRGWNGGVYVKSESSARATGDVPRHGNNLKVGDPTWTRNKRSVMPDPAWDIRLDHPQTRFSRQPGPLSAEMP